MEKIYQFHNEVEYYKTNGTKELKELIKNKGKKGVISITDIDECLL